MRIPNNSPGDYFKILYKESYRIVLFDFSKTFLRILQEHNFFFFKYSLKVYSSNSGMINFINSIGYIPRISLKGFSYFSRHFSRRFPNITPRFFSGLLPSKAPRETCGRTAPWFFLIFLQKSFRWTCGRTVEKYKKHTKEFLELFLNTSRFHIIQDSPSSPSRILCVSLSARLNLCSSSIIGRTLGKLFGGVIRKILCGTFGKVAEKFLDKSVQKLALEFHEKF